MAILYRYDESQNREGGFLPGVPLADLTYEVYEALPDHLKASVKRAAFYIHAPTEARLAHAKEDKADKRPDETLAEVEADASGPLSMVELEPGDGSMVEVSAAGTPAAKDGE